VRDFFTKNRKTPGSGDPDLDAAYDELDAFLNGDTKRTTNDDTKQHTSENTNSHTNYNTARSAVPGDLQKDFAELGLAPGASLAACKAAYKKLLKIHHPDHHAGNSANMQKATQKSARLNNAMDRIEKWYGEGGK
jgi:DnaJ-domain-containing protein 1